jgi:hypothetical protein
MITTAAPVSVPTPNIETISEFFERCPTRDEITQINADLKISVEYDPTAGVNVCHISSGSDDLSLLQKRIYQTIYVMKLFKFSQPLPWTDMQMYDWMTNTITGIRFVRGGVSHCCDPENTIVIALESDSMLLTTDQWVINDGIHGLIDATLLYAHETRHNEGFHHSCTTRNGDDNVIDEMGAWSIQYYLALWIAQYGDRAFLTPPNGSPNRYREASLEQAELIRLTRFCMEVYDDPATTLIP